MIYRMKKDIMFRTGEDNWDEMKIKSGLVFD